LLPPLLKFAILSFFLFRFLLLLLLFFYFFLSPAARSLVDGQITDSDLPKPNPLAILQGEREDPNNFSVILII
jgi:hypothetical protein